MLSETRKSIILHAIRNDADCGAGLEDSFSLDEMLFYIRSLQSLGSRVGKETIQKAVKLLRKHSPWYVLTVGEEDIPYIENNRGYVFSDPGAGMQAKKVFASMGHKFDLMKTEPYDELPFDMFARYGVQTVSINKGTFGIALKTDILSKNTTENSTLNNAVLKFAVASKIGAEDIEQVDRTVSEEILRSDLYYLPEGNMPSPMQEIVEFSDGSSAIGGYLFSDRKEASLVYLDKISQLRKAPARKLMRTDPLIGKYVLNPGSINLLVSQAIIDAVVKKEI